MASVASNSALLGDDDMNIPPDLKELDESLRCCVCGEYFHAAVTISEEQCGHSFCSECIRNHFRHQMKSVHRTTSCPTCRQPVRDKALVPNRDLQQAVLAYRKSLLKRQKLEAIREQSPMATPSPAPRSVRSSRRSMNRGELAANETGAEALIEESASSMDSEVVLQEAPRRKKPAANFSVMKKRKLQDLCEKDGLPTNGSEQELRERLESFTALWNAETDAINPRSDAELCAVVRSRENQRRMELMHSSEKADSRALQEHLRNGGGESRPTAFSQKLSNNYKNMIEKMKQQWGKDRKQKKSSPDGEQENKPEESPLDGVVTESADQSTEIAVTDVEDPVVTSSDVSEEVVAPATRTVSLDELGNSGSAPPGIQPEGAIVVDLLNEETQSNHHPAGSSSPANSRRGNEPTLEPSPLPKRQRRSIIQAWSCTTCTFLNEKYISKNAKCEVCGKKRPEL